MWIDEISREIQRLADAVAELDRAVRWLILSWLITAALVLAGAIAVVAVWL